MPQPTRIVVVGADAAGMSAAHQALRGGRARGRDLDVVVLESTEHTSYSACGIPYWIAGDVDDSRRWSPARPTSTARLASTCAPAPPRPASTWPGAWCTTATSDTRPPTWRSTSWASPPARRPRYPAGP